MTRDWLTWYEVNAYGSTGGLRGRKHFLHEGGIKVPAMIRYPGRLPAGIRSNQLMIGTDWFATLLSLAGVPVPKDRPIDSIDMSFALTQPKQSAPRLLHWALPTPTGLDFAVREGSLKLLTLWSFLTSSALNRPSPHAYSRTIMTSYNGSMLTHC